MDDYFEYDPLAGTPFAPGFDNSPYASPYMPTPDKFIYDPTAGVSPMADPGNPPYVAPHIPGMPVPATPNKFVYTPTAGEGLDAPAPFPGQPAIPPSMGADGNLYDPYLDLLSDDRDIMSGLPTSCFRPMHGGGLSPLDGGSDATESPVDNRSVERMKLDRVEAFEQERDTAVRNYQDAMSRGDYDEALKWETLANDRQRSIYTTLDVTSYGLPIKAPGID